MSFLVVIISGILSFAHATPPIAKSKPARRGIASTSPAESNSLCEEIKKLSYACVDSLDKISVGVEELNRKQFRQAQSEIALKRRQVSEQGKSCPTLPATDACYDQAAKILAQKNVRKRDIKNENTSELLGFGSEVLLKIGNPQGRMPAANSR